MTAVDNLWYAADEATQRAEQVYHEFAAEYDAVVEYDRTQVVSRRRFKTVVDRIRENGLPYGAHSLVYTDGGKVLLVRHEGVDMWVVPGGEVAGDESYRAGARRELHEEAGIGVEFAGLGMLVRVTFRCDDYETMGVLPIFEGHPESTDLTVRDPDEEISAARWFETLPPDTRDREEIRAWRARHDDLS